MAYAYMWSAALGVPRAAVGGVVTMGFPPGGHPGEHPECVGTSGPADPPPARETTPVRDAEGPRVHDRGPRHKIPGVTPGYKLAHPRSATGAAPTQLAAGRSRMVTPVESGGRMHRACRACIAFAGGPPRVWDSERTELLSYRSSLIVRVGLRPSPPRHGSASERLVL